MFHQMICSRNARINSINKQNPNIEKISEFHFRTNYEYFGLPQGGHLILYEDHRCLLNVLFEARRVLGLDLPNLLYFDYRDDAAGGWTLNRALAAMGSG